MPKPNKSSASSGTRKKHARKNNDTPEGVSIAKAGGRTKKQKALDPRPKGYIPPVKPTASRPDPLDTQGLASQLPPDLVVLLRAIGKKDTTTKQRALEKLQDEWLSEANIQNPSGRSVEYVDLLLPVWVRSLLHRLNCY